MPNNIKFLELSLPVVLKTRELLRKRFERYCKDNIKDLIVDLSSLTYTFNDNNLEYRIVDFGFKTGTCYSGSLIADLKSGNCLYACGLFIDGTTVEFLGNEEYDQKRFEIFMNGQILGEIHENKLNEKATEWIVIQQEHLFGSIRSGSFIFFDKWLWSSRSMPNMPVLMTSMHGDLTVSLDRRSDTIFDFLVTILKLITLYGLWMPKWVKNDDTVIPASVEISGWPRDDLMLYFAVNICFRCLLFDHFFSSRSGP